VTEPPQGRDGSPSVAALAVQVDSLRRDVESLAAKVKTFAAKQREQAAALADITELREQVEQILAIVTGGDDASPVTWFWLTMSKQERNQKFSELSDWVETVLRAQYPDYLAEQIRPCWPNHPEARWELAWLYQMWSLAYLAERRAPKDAADWHDRWAPGAIRRLGQVMIRCERGCQRQPTDG
jgi:hypothetical protein